MIDLNGLPPTISVEETQEDALQSCYELCLEGVEAFKKLNLIAASKGCAECADNIKELANKHGYELRKPR